MPRRRLSPEEEALWQKVADQTDRLNSQSGAQSVFDVERLKPTPNPERPKKPLRFSAPKPQTQTARIDLAPTISEHVNQSKLQMDKKTFSQMKRGKLRPEGKLDLHGMTLDEAHSALTRFILSAQSSGKRLVLVVTGKGKRTEDTGPIPVRHGVLRHQVPQWLSQMPLSLAVLQIAQAHGTHGGGGAYYVYLRKRG